MIRFKVTIRPTDRIFSEIVRSTGCCEICGRSDIKLEAAHFFGRAKESVRFDPRNVHCLCFTCHRKSHEGDPCYKDFMLRKYGRQGLDLLEFDSNQYCKRDDDMTKLYLKQLLTEKE